MKLLYTINKSYKYNDIFDYINNIIICIILKMYFFLGTKLNNKIDLYLIYEHINLMRYSFLHFLKYLYILIFYYYYLLRFFLVNNNKEKR